MSAVKMSDFARTIMEQKYSHVLKDNSLETWENIAYRVTKHVMRSIGYDMRDKLSQNICKAITERKFLPAGRYLYAAGRPRHQVCNCYLFNVHDSREGWADLLHDCAVTLMTGGGAGVNYSGIRPEGARIRGTGGTATGPIALMQMLNECGRGIMMGGSRRCLPASAPVTMADGSKRPIKDVQVGDLVHTQFGPRRVLRVFKQGPQQVYRIKTTHGNLYSTGNHRWWGCALSRTPKWVTTDKIRPGWKIYRSTTPVQAGVGFDKDWAYTLGYYLGNGTAAIYDRTAEVAFTVGKRNANRETVATIIRGMRRFSEKYAIRDGGEHGKYIDIRYRKKPLVTMFQRYKAPNSPFKIPTEIWAADADTKSAFLAGWFDADGDLRKDNTIRLANKYPSVLEEVKELLYTLGFRDICISEWYLSLSARQTDLFNATIGKYTNKYPRLEAHGLGLQFSKVLKVRKAWIRDTYDLEIEGEHQFVAYEHISHNSALWAGLRWDHQDIYKFIQAKNWSPEVRKLKNANFNFPATLDQTNISVCLNDAFFDAYLNEDNPKHTFAHSVYWAVVERMLKTGEPGFSVDTGKNKNDILRNPCCEICSSDNNDVCDLGSINMARVESIEEFESLVEMATVFLLAGTVYTHLPFSGVEIPQSKNRRLGLGLLGVHEWLLKRGKKYGPDHELWQWLKIYMKSTEYAHAWADEFELSRPVKTRAIAPTGTVSILAETTGGIEPIFCVAYKRRYLKHTSWHYQYVVDPTAARLIENGVDPDLIEDAYDLANDVERRVEFQAWIQQAVDHCISSTVNLPHWGSERNNEDTVRDFGNMLMKYLPKLRGITVYPDGARDGQPLTPVAYKDAIGKEGEVIEEAGNVCEISKGGSCGD